MRERETERKIEGEKGRKRERERARKIEGKRRRGRFEVSDRKRERTSIYPFVFSSHLFHSLFFINLQFVFFLLIIFPEALRRAKNLDISTSMVKMR